MVDPNIAVFIAIIRKYTYIYKYVMTPVENNQAQF